MSRKVALQPVDYHLLNMLYRYKYLDLKFINNHIYPGIKDRYNVTKRLNKLVKQNIIIQYTYVKNKLDICDSIIYTLSEDGFNIAREKYDWVEFDKDGSIQLRQTYEHNIIVANFLYDYKLIDEAGEIYDEKDCYHKYKISDEKRARIIRPDGAYFMSEGYLFLIEYEHSNDRRSLIRKLNRYNDYIINKRYMESVSYENIKDRIKYVAVLLVTNDKLSSSTIKNIKEMNLKYDLLTAEVHEWIKSPRGNIYYDIKLL